MSQPHQQNIIVIAHRGASGYRPEHTQGAYELAVAQGADFIEPDLVLTKDGHLIVRHENELGGTTDVGAHKQFRDRYTTKTIDGIETSGWFSEDFLLSEIKTLRAMERIPDIRPNNRAYDGEFEILTLVEVIELARQLERVHQRPIGIYPETKHPTYFQYEGKRLDGQPIGHCISSTLIQTLVEEDYLTPQRVFIQSFEIQNLLLLKQNIMPKASVELPLIQLLGDLTLQTSYPDRSFSQPYDMVFNSERNNDLAHIYGPLSDLVSITSSISYVDLLLPEVLKNLRDTYATGLGPWKTSLFLEHSDTPLPFVRQALEAGLEIHPYTLRQETRFLPVGSQGNILTVEEEIQRLLSIGVTGFFVDFPDIGVRIRDRFISQHETH